MNICSKCDAELIENVNWTAGFVKRRYFRCKTCIVQREREWRIANPKAARETKARSRIKRKEADKLLSVQYYAANADALRRKRREYHNEHTEQANASSRAWKAQNKEAVRAYNAAYKLAHPEKLAAKSARRRAQKRNATVSWADNSVIESYYAAAIALTKLTGAEWVVDHIIPLQGKHVSGLHHQDNLRVIPRVINASKKNKFDPADHELRLL